MEMTRESEALRTEIVHRLLGVFLPAGGSYRWGDGDKVVNGVFLEAADLICIDAYRRRYSEEGELRHMRRRIIIRVAVEESDLGTA